MIRNSSVCVGVVVFVIFAGLAPSTASAGTCDEWVQEHAEWRTTVERRFVAGDEPESIDSAIYQVMKREVWLTSCSVSAAEQRANHVGWRLMGRSRSEYGQAFMESLLERAGFASGLEELAAKVQVVRTENERGR